MWCFCLTWTYNSQRPYSLALCALFDTLSFPSAQFFVLFVRWLYFFRIDRPPPHKRPLIMLDSVKLSKCLFSDVASFLSRYGIGPTVRKWWCNRYIHLFGFGGGCKNNQHCDRHQSLLRFYCELHMRLFDTIIYAVPFSVQRRLFVFVCAVFLFLVIKAFNLTFHGIVKWNKLFSAVFGWLEEIRISISIGHSKAHQASKLFFKPKFR